LSAWTTHRLKSFRRRIKIWTKFENKVAIIAGLNVEIPLCVTLMAPAHRIRRKLTREPINLLFYKSERMIGTALTSTVQQTLPRPVYRSIKLLRVCYKRRDVTNALKHFLIGQFVKFFLLIGPSNTSNHL